MKRLTAWFREGPCDATTAISGHIHAAYRRRSPISTNEPNNGRFGRNSWQFSSSKRKNSNVEVCLDVPLVSAHCFTYFKPESWRNTTCDEASLVCRTGHVMGSHFILQLGVFDEGSYPNGWMVFNSGKIPI